MSMREIKVRAWDRERRVFVFVQLQSGMVSVRGIEECDTKCYTSDEVVAVSIGGDAGNRPVLDLFQEYTGLKDKNGTEIYEGDLIYDTVQVPNPSLYEVVYEYATFVLVNTGLKAPGSKYSPYCPYDKGEIYNPKDRHYRQPVFTLNPGIERRMVVVGNIYESTEMLEEQRRLQAEANERWKAIHKEKTGKKP